MRSRYGPSDLFLAPARSRAAACASFVATLLLSVVAVQAGATELRASYENFDAEGFKEGYANVAPDVDRFGRLVDTLRERSRVAAERTATARHREAIAIAELLADGAQRFEELHRKQVAEMASEVERARQDKDIRRIRYALNLCAAILSFTAELERPSSPTSGTERGTGELGPDAPDGSKLVDRRGEQTVKIRVDGKWRTIDTKQIFQQRIISPMNGGGSRTPIPDATGNSLSGLADFHREMEIISPMNGDDSRTPIPDAIGNSLDGLADSYGEWVAAAEIPPIDCDNSFRGCFAVDWDGPGGSAPAAPASIAPPRRAPTPAEAGLYRAVKALASFSADMMPVVGPAKSVVEIATGKDSITGEPIPPAVAAAGLVLSVVPGGKLLAKTGGKAAIEYGATVFRHYTSRGGLGRIYKTGVIKADNEGRVFAVLADGRPLSRRDAVRQLGLDDKGKAQDFIEFRLPVGTPIRKNPVSPELSEFVIKGDVRLAPGSGVRFIQRRWGE